MKQNGIFVYLDNESEKLLKEASDKVFLNKSAFCRTIIMQEVTKIIGDRDDTKNNTTE